MTIPRLSVVPSADSHRKVATTVNQLLSTTTRYQGLLSVKGFGAKGDSDINASIGTDDTAAIQAAIDFIDTQGGGTLFFPAGHYKITSYLTACKFLTLLGEGNNSSIIVSAHAGGGGANAFENLRNGSALVSLSTVNGSTITRLRLNSIGFQNSNASNVGAAVYERAGSEIAFVNCGFGGFKYGAVLDQSELLDIDLCSFASQLAGGAGVWIVNGDDLNATAASGFTNRISVKRCQFNQLGTVYGILDDGGLNHSFEDNNYNGCLNHIRAAGATMTIRGGEYEGATGNCIALSNVSLGGRSVGGSITSVHGGSFSVAIGKAAIAGIGTASGNLQVDGYPLFTGGGGTAPITGAASFVAIYLITYDNQSGSPSAVKDGNGSFYDVDIYDGGSFLHSAGLKLGLPASVATTAPVPLNMGGSYSSVAGAHPKLITYDDGTGLVGTGVSAGSADYIASLGGNTVHSFYCDGTKSLIVHGGGITFVPASGSVPVNNGEVTFALTSNTTLVVKAKGSDGVIRSSTLTLA